jgi:hypothetical protein
MTILICKTPSRFSSSLINLGILLETQSI